MQAGKLREVITLEALTRTTSNGFARESWAATYSNVPASVVSLSARELFLAERPVTNISHRIFIRYLDNVTSKMRLKWGSRTFTIQSVIADAKRTQIELACSEQA